MDSNRTSMSWMSHGLTTKSPVLWNVTPWGLVDHQQHFLTNVLPQSSWSTTQIRYNFSETSEKFHHISLCHILEHKILHDMNCYMNCFWSRNTRKSSRDTTVNTGQYGLRNWRKRVRLSTKTREYLFSAASFLWVNQQKCEADHSPLSSVEIKNVSSCTSTPPYVSCRDT
jgi:hypothetical protein